MKQEIEQLNRDITIVWDDGERLHVSRHPPASDNAARDSQPDDGCEPADDGCEEASPRTSERGNYMKQGFKQLRNSLDVDRNPTGGYVVGTGITIVWQNGPLGRGEDRQEPNGAFVEDVIQAAIERLEFYQCSMFGCSANETALAGLRLAMEALRGRTLEREEREVEGTHVA